MQAARADRTSRTRARLWHQLGAVVVAVAGLLSTATMAWGLGELSQRPGTGDCISETGGSPVYFATGPKSGTVSEPERNKGICRDGWALSVSEEIAISPDGRSVYVTSYGGTPSTLTTLDRNPRSGRLTQKKGVDGCVSEDADEVDGKCASGRALDEPQGVVISPDGRHVYVTSFDSDAVAIFDRGPKGALKQKSGAAGCISETGDDGHGGPCQAVKSVQSPAGIAISPDGRSVYVTAVDRISNDKQTVDPTGRSVSIFDRDPATGALTQKPGLAGCVSGTGTGGGCQLVRGVAEPVQVVVSHDGRSVYVTSLDPEAVAIFDRDPASGVLTQKPGAAGCISKDGTAGSCQASGIAVQSRLALSADGESAYAASHTAAGVVIFDRDRATGALAPVPGPAGCVSQAEKADCRHGKALGYATAVAISSDDRSVYVTSKGSMAIFDRDPTTGGLRQKQGRAGCVAQEPKQDRCRKGKALSGAFGLLVSPDNKNVYVASIISSAVSTFARSLR